MNSVFVEQLKRIRHLAVFLLLLNVVALALAAGGDSSVALVALLVVLLLTTSGLLFVLRNRSMTWAATQEHEPLLAIDPNTGIATEYWYHHMLALECRRAVREFSPLTVLCIDLGEKVERRHLLELVRVLGEEFSRPGDLIGWNADRAIGAVLPSTNENANQLVIRCFERIKGHEATADLPLHIVGKTFQPRGDLNLGKVQQQLDLHLQHALQDEPGVYFHAEDVTDPATPGITYTDS
ncbi:MAG: hypothetical protein GYB41_13595 [Oceanospirillales bacterium]|nr:hypothetical protein [Oceanospirillales bacterium]